MSWDSSGTDVKTSKTPESTILFSLAGQTTIRQVEVSTTTQKRGLTESAALALAGVTYSNDFASATYYKHIDGRTYSFTANTAGKITTKVASRANEAHGWTVTITEVEYSVTPSPTSNGWSTTPIDSNGNTTTLSSGGTSGVISYDRATSNVAWDVASVVTTTTTEIRNIDTQAHAQAIVNNNQNDTAQDAVVYMWQHLNGSWITSAWVRLMIGTQTSSSARYVSAEAGWTVTIVTKVYSWSSPRKASNSSGEGWWQGSHDT